MGASLRARWGSLAIDPVTMRAGGVVVVGEPAIDVDAIGANHAARLACRASRRAGDQVERATAPFGTTSRTVRWVLLGRRPDPDRTSSSTPIHRPCARAGYRQRTRPGCTTGIPAVTRARDSAPASRRVPACSVPSCPGWCRHSSRGAGPASTPQRRHTPRSETPTEAVGTCPRHTLNSISHALEPRATLRRIETESTFRQATGEPPIVDEAIVGTRDMPGHIACLHLGALGRIGARSPKGDAGKGSGLGTTGLPAPCEEERRDGRHRPKDPAAGCPLREVDRQLIEGGCVHGTGRSSAHGPRRWCFLCRE